MKPDKRSHPRFHPEGLVATIRITLESPDKVISLRGDIIDLSCTGIKIRLDRPLMSDIDNSEIKILIRMPHSGVEASIHGRLRHCSDHGLCGLQFTAGHENDDMTQLMLNCIKPKKTTPSEVLSLA